MIYEVGFVGRVTPVLQASTSLLVLLFGIEQWVALGRCKNWRQHVRQNWLHLATAALSALMMILLIATELRLGPGNRVVLLLYGVVQGAIFTALSLRALRHQAKLTALKLRPGWLLMGSFALIITVGTLLLKLPRAVEEGHTLTWTNALFTSTSAVCVTGLVVENTAEFFTPTGQIIILGLIQVGGLGIMTITFYLATMLFQGMSLHDRQVLGEMISEKHLAQVSLALRFIVAFTLLTELLGAVLLYQLLPGTMAMTDRLFHAVFHSISAFCNAGFSTLPNGLADDALKGNGAFQLTVAMLIVFGGLGSMVIRDLLAWCRGWYFLKQRPELARPRLRVHTRLVLVITAILLAAGSALIWMSEFALRNGPANGGQFLTALFHSVTARTAGFNTVDMSSIGTLTIHLYILLMLIGGSPGGTAGGLRTTVFAVSTLHLWNQLRLIPRLVLFRRRMPEGLGGRAQAIIVLTAIWLFINFMILRQIQPGGADSHLLFELVSAFATVGLSVNLTQDLTEPARLLIVLNMFVGRVGLLTVASTLMPVRRRQAPNHPTEEILLV